MVDCINTYTQNRPYSYWLYVFIDEIKTGLFFIISLYTKVVFEQKVFFSSVLVFW